MALLLMGFRPVIADIDTVWLHDPVSIVKRGNLIYPQPTQPTPTFTPASMSMSVSMSRHGEVDEEEGYETNQDNLESSHDNNTKGGNAGGATNTNADANANTNAKANNHKNGRIENLSIESVDLSVTNDNGEICGCFVAVNNTPRAR